MGNGLNQREMPCFIGCFDLTRYTELEPETYVTVMRQNNTCLRQNN